MAETIAKLVIKKTADAAAAPAVDFVMHGELAINYTDGKLYYRDNLNAIQVIGIKNPVSRTADNTFTGNNIFQGTGSYTAANTFSSASNSFTGNGANLTSLSAANVSAGTLADGRLSSNVALKNGTNTFSGVNTFSGQNSFTNKNTFSAQATFKSVALQHLALTGGVIAWDGELGNLASVTLTEDSSLSTITNAAAGTYILRVIQDGTGGHALTFGANFKSVDGVDITISPDANSISILTILKTNDTDFYIMAQSNFALIGLAPALSTFILTVDSNAVGAPSIDGDYYRFGDVLGTAPTWRKSSGELDTEVPVIISTGGGDNLSLFRQVADGSAYDPDFTFDGMAWTNVGTNYTGNITLLTETNVMPDYIATHAGTGNQIALFQRDDVFLYDAPVAPGIAYVGFAGDGNGSPVPSGGTFTPSYLMLYNAGGHWYLNVQESAAAAVGYMNFLNGMYHVDLVTTALPVGPLGGYGFITEPGTEPDYNNPTIGAAAWNISAYAGQPFVFPELPEFPPATPPPQSNDLVVSGVVYDTVNFGDNFGEPNGEYAEIADINGQPAWAKTIVPAVDPGMGSAYRYTISWNTDFTFYSFNFEAFDDFGGVWVGQSILAVTDPSGVTTPTTGTWVDNGPAYFGFDSTAIVVAQA